MCFGIYTFKKKLDLIRFCPVYEKKTQQIHRRYSRDQLVDARELARREVLYNGQPYCVLLSFSSLSSFFFCVRSS